MSEMQFFISKHLRLYFNVDVIDTLMTLYINNSALESLAIHSKNRKTVIQQKDIHVELPSYKKATLGKITFTKIKEDIYIDYLIQS